MGSISREPIRTLPRLALLFALGAVAISQAAGEGRWLDSQIPWLGWQVSHPAGWDVAHSTLTCGGISGLVATTTYVSQPPLVIGPIEERVCAGSGPARASDDVVAVALSTGQGGAVVGPERDTPLPFEISFEEPRVITWLGVEGVTWYGQDVVIGGEPRYTLNVWIGPRAPADAHWLAQRIVRSLRPAS